MSADPHSSPIKTPRQLITVVLLAFVVPIVVIVLLASYAARGGAGADAAAMKPEAVAQRLAPIGQVEKQAASGDVKALQTGEAVYNASCVACHGAGIAGAPKTGDAGAWSPRIGQGFDTLVKHAVGGYKAMPPKGGNAALDPIEVARAVAFMGNKSGAKFKEPETKESEAAAK